VLGFCQHCRAHRPSLGADIPSGTRFEMREAFSGLMLPMIRGSLPDFGPPFEQWAKDLARASEAG